MTLYHAFEILLVGTVVGACSVSVARRYLPALREWMHLGPVDAKPTANCGSSGCDGCSPSKQAHHH
ncbi:hypothetical protein [Stenotrophobium rhamnosiphilum]|uniref:Uncharacterized protein n=1 Tax=Stenotrophobium rhamnosiphilum TaxID=2029166 RepID=A0A2T5MK70_9GAMM|nr:hypothetical protein [Stenotrophobium rhamnosiphilum]PTU32965.1 hypothetical protein CJD38_02300 [Stenotrophobium rhamnosiphilum]